MASKGRLEYEADGESPVITANPPRTRPYRRARTITTELVHINLLSAAAIMISAPVVALCLVFSATSSAGSCPGRPRSSELGTAEGRIGRLRLQGWDLDDGRRHRT